MSKEQKELIKAVNNRVAVQAKKKEKEQRRRFMSEFIQFKILDDLGRSLVDEDGQVLKNSEFKIARKNINNITINDYIVRCPFPDLEIDFYTESDTNEALWLDDLRVRAKTLPTYYTVVPVFNKVPEDIRDNKHYEGQAIMILHNMPLKCQDESMDVDAKTLREYFLCAICEVDPSLVPYRQAVEDAKNALNPIDRKIREVETMNFKEIDGSKMTGKRLVEERRGVIAAYVEQRVAQEGVIKVKEAKLAEQISWRRRIGLEFDMLAVDEVAQTASWHIRIYNAANAADIEDRLVAKKNWGGIRLASWSRDPDLPPWAGRGRVPGPQPVDYSHLEVRVGGCQIERTPHGVGAWKQSERKSTRISDERFGLYFGDWMQGKKNGQGVEIDDSGVFNGRFVANWKEGPARYDLADGTTIVGRWNKSPYIKSEQLGQNPYLDGEPNGEVEILFGDGGFYKGFMQNGRITGGHGIYQSAFNEIISGTWKDGMLHGKEGSKKNYAGEVMEGTWENGLLHGEGKYKNDRGDWYEGWWEHGLRHGRGAAKFNGRGFYRGYFVHDMFHGKGELHFSKRLTAREKRKAAEQEERNRIEAEAEVASKATQVAATWAEVGSKSKSSSTSGSKPIGKRGGRLATNAEKKIAEAAAAALAGDAPPIDNRSEFRRAFYGYFIGHDLANGGIIVNSESLLTRSTSRRNTIALAPVINMKRKMKKTMHRIRRKIEKFTSMELFVRNDITRKKTRIFRQQRHLTKKTMYALDKREGIIEEKQAGDESDSDDEDPYNAKVSDRKLEKELLRDRMGARRYRLENTDLDKMRPSKPLVPRLGLISTEQQTIHSKVVNSITTDPDSLDKHRVKRLLPRIAASDMEEAAERQRYLKYDAIWARAQDAFTMKRRSAADEVEAQEAQQGTLNT